MATVSTALYSFNSGVVSTLALARVDTTDLRVAAEVQQNLLPMVLGPAIMRSGSEYIDRTVNDETPVYIPFIYNESARAMAVVTDSGVQFLIDDVFLARESVTATIANPNFTTNLVDWLASNDVGCTTTWAAGGFLKLLGTGSNFATISQHVVVIETGVEHALRVVIERGPVTFRIGSTLGDDDYVSEVALGTGTHSLAFTPSGDFYIKIMSSADIPKYVSSVDIEATGTVTLDNPWAGSNSSLRYAQSGNTDFIACDGFEQRILKTYRSDMRSWGIYLYQTEDGPFDFPNTGAVSITPSAVSGPVTLTASDPLWSAGHVGSLIRLKHSGQTATATVAGPSQYSDYIRVTGLGTNGNTQRTFSVTITGTFTGTIVLEQSLAEPGAWTSFRTYTAADTDTINDRLDNQIIYYRIGFGSTYTSGSAVVTLVYSNSIQKGIARITEFTNSQSVSADVLSTFGRAAVTTDWEEGEWSGVRGFPSSVSFHDGRLGWGFEDFLYLSVSDAFDSFDDNFVGDAGPIVRSIATGPIDGVRWLLSIQRLIAGGSLQEVSIRASSFDEPLTPTQFTARNFSTRGSADIQAVRVDNNGLFVQRNGKRVYVLRFEYTVGDFISEDATRVCPEICDSGVIGIAVQRQPDTRIWFCLDDGTAAVLTYEPADKVLAWTTVTTNGLIKAVGVLPGATDDAVYWAVQREPTSGTIMAVERLATRDEAKSGTTRKVMDSHLTFSGAATDTFSMQHLKGMGVVAWGDGVPISGEFTVDGTTGMVTLDDQYSDVVIGLAYDAKFKSAKMAYGAVAGTALSKQKRISRYSLIMNDVTWYGVYIGKDFDNMNRLPPTLGSGRALVNTETIDQWDYDMSAFNGGWGPDERFCFKVSSPYGAEFLGLVLTIETSEPQIYGNQVSQGNNG